MKIRIKKILSIFLIAIIGFTGIGSTYFFESEQEIGSEETNLVSYSDLIPAFDQGLEFASSKINVPGFKVLDTVFDLVNEPSDFLFSLAENGSLKVNWLEKCNRFFCIHTLLYPFHYFW
jgi:hypothetical protein